MEGGGGGRWGDGGGRDEWMDIGRACREGSREE